MLTHIYDLNYAVVRERERVYVSRAGYEGVIGEIKHFGQYPSGIVWASVKFEDGRQNRFNSDELYKIGGVK